jgi:hypothetical protein
MNTATGFSGALSDANMQDVEHPPTADPSCENKDDNDAPTRKMKNILSPDRMQRPWKRQSTSVY